MKLHRTLALACSAAALLASCATTAESLHGYRQWDTSARAQAQAGSLTWSAYYQQAFDRLTAIPPSLEQDTRLEATVNLLSLARKHDAGDITAAQFDAQRTAIEAALQQRLSR